VNSLNRSLVFAEINEKLSYREQQAAAASRNGQKEDLHLKGLQHGYAHCLIALSQ